MDYIYIRRWGRFLGSNQSYVEGQVNRAKRDGAPPNAVYLSVDDGTWHTTDNIKNPVARKALGIGDRSYGAVVTGGGSGPRSGARM